MGVGRDGTVGVEGGLGILGLGLVSHALTRTKKRRLTERNRVTPTLFLVSIDD